MGLREHTDFNLQLVSLGCVLVTLLVLAAARRYSGDWRARRTHRRQLARTRRRLAGAHANGSVQGQQGQGQLQGQHRRRWKRFVAAVPLVPLATAYVGARVGWDVFQVLVFCAIDVARDAAGGAAAGLRRLAAAASTHAGHAWTRLDLGARAAAAVVLVVEGCVGWLFGRGFPAVARAAQHATRWAHGVAEWWAARGGPALRDAIEVAVLEYLVPAAAATRRAAGAAYGRGAWLAAQTYEAVAILARDVARDLRVWAAWAAWAGAWAADAQRWWFDPRLRRWFDPWLRRALSDARRLRAFAAARLLPFAAAGIEAAAVGAYVWVLCPLSGAAAALGANIHTLAGAGLRWAALALAAWGARLWGPVARYGAAAGAWAALAARALAAQTRRGVAWAVPAAAGVAAACSDVYVQVQDTIGVPLVRTAESVGARMRQLAAAAEPWARAWWQQARRHGAAVFWLALALARVCAQRAWLAFGALADAIGQQQRRLWQAVRSYGGVVSETGARLMGQWLAAGARQTGQWLAAVWPEVRRGAGDGMRAMADVYAQLAALVDAAIAFIGDVIVDYARRNAVHAAQSNAGSGKKDL
ncbi:hypothetical protein IWW55_003708 [Coemansia sp. RSA 2706]|nr:hypothetical protein IWW55_003708 [Coemansia sp. RSA 2706]